MRISVKDKSTNVVICKCGWKGQIQDAYWMHEEEYGKCPDCGSEDIGRRGDEVYCKKCGLVIE